MKKKKKDFFTTNVCQHLRLLTETTISYLSEQFCCFQHIFNDNRNHPICISQSCMISLFFICVKDKSC